MTQTAVESSGRDGISRRGVVTAVAAGAAVGTLGRWPTRAASSATPAAPAIPPSGGTPVPATGQPVPELAPVEAVLRDLMARLGLPGAQLALAKAGRLVFNRGYGPADVERGEPV